MDGGETFDGFPKECISFFRELSVNNSIHWFKQHKREYDEFVLKPVRCFVYDMGERLRLIAPRISADPRTNRSLFRINRDIRFSDDKTPYKTHLAVWFWEGSGPRMECSGFYFHLEPDTLMLGVGIYRFPKPLLEKYRTYAVHKKYGTALEQAINNITGTGNITLGGAHYKRIPGGFDPHHKNAALLLHNGLYAGEETPIPDELFSGELVDYCFERFILMAPLHRWLVNLTD